VALQHLASKAKLTFESLHGLSDRERRRLLDELMQTRDLMPLLMKQRNGLRWSREDREALRGHFERLSRMSPYLVMVVMPGGLLVLPVFAWWLDRRRFRQRQGGPTIH
jgi:hypothetical protein